MNSLYSATGDGEGTFGVIVTVGVQMLIGVGVTVGVLMSVSTGDGVAVGV
jgi:hypothetical protein